MMFIVRTEKDVVGVYAAMLIAHCHEKEELI